MTSAGFAGTPKLNWALTTEVGDSIVLPEAVVDGLKSKVGDLKTKVIGEQIYQFFVRLLNLIMLSGFISF